MSSEEALGDPFTRMRDQVAQLFEDRATFTAAQPVLIGGSAGAWATITIHDVPSICYRIASVVSPKQELIEITYLCPSLAPHAQAVFDHCLQSVRFEKGSPSPAPGYRRAHQSALSLDVPIHLGLPSVMSFLSDGERVRVQVAVGRDLSELRTASSEEMTRGARIENFAIRPYERGEIRGECSSRFSHIHGRQYSVHHALLSAATGNVRRWLSIECRGSTVPSGAHVKHVFDRIVETVHAELSER